MRVSDELRRAVKSSRLRQYQFAAALGIHRTVFSPLINGVTRVRRDDPRVLKLADLLQVPYDEAFEDDPPAEFEMERLSLALVESQGRQ